MLFEYKANGDFRKLRDDFNRLITKAQDLVNPILADNGFISDCQMYFPAIDLDGNMAILLFTKLNSLSSSSSSIFETSTLSNPMQEFKYKNFKKCKKDNNENKIRIIKIEIA